MDGRAFVGRYWLLQFINISKDLYFMKLFRIPNNFLSSFTLKVKIIKFEPNTV